MVEKFIRAYVWIFGRKIFVHWNKLLYRFSIGGLGILNYHSSRVTGEREFLRKYLPTCTGVVLDVGANRGEYTRTALEFNEKTVIYAFEPHPKTFGWLKDNLSKYKSVRAINQGLSAQSGRAKLYDYADRDGSTHASLYRAVIEDIRDAESAVVHDVEIITLDEFVELERLSDISLVKIDTEGNELDILRGGRKTLESGIIRAIHFEFNEMNVVSRTYFKDFWELLNGYRLFRLLPNGMYEIKSYSPLHCEIFAYQNIVALRR